ncbi:cupin domain-containing protein [uncultured Alsobacter sp.]|uniref:cupin domain-containing protein n=1 Tax=uncultured Alsobacter sp. TaxID=1748258 RepID=UPI0025D40EDB|nr:cupin domain-containing protein [uncultured Alsobacter sp.]
MSIVRSGDAFPAWCQLQSFEIVDLAPEETLDRTRRHRRERILVTAGVLQIAHAAGSLSLREGQFFDVADPGPYSLRSRSAPSQFIRMSGRWGDEVAGCGVFRIADEADPTDTGDPVAYAKTTRMDSHYHDYDEYWFLLEGRATVVVGGRFLDMRPGDAVTIGMGHHHDLAHAPEPVKAAFFETTLERGKRMGHLWEHTHGRAEPDPERV